MDSARGEKGGEGKERYRWKGGGGGEGGGGEERDTEEKKDIK